LLTTALYVPTLKLYPSLSSTTLTHILISALYQQIALFGWTFSDRPNRKLYVSQVDFVNKILTKFNLDLCLPKSIPADPNARLTASMSPNSLPDAINPLSTRHREAIGCLMYIMTMTRPDFAYAVGQASQFCQNPGDGHWNGVKRIFAYFAGSAQLGLCFDGQLPGPRFILLREQIGVKPIFSNPHSLRGGVGDVAKPWWLHNLTQLFSITLSLFPSLLVLSMSDECD
jgi:hypothetical protein